ncbi:GNAT family protein [Bacillota bacterium]
MLTGERIYLRLIEERDIPFKVRWVNDPDIRKTLSSEYPVSEESARQLLKNYALDSSRREFIVCLNEKDFPIGFGGFTNIDVKNSKAETYMVVGQKEYWGKGFAGEIRKLLLEYAFEELGLNRVYSYVMDENEKMISLNKKFGFETEGLLRDCVFVKGKFRNLYVMSILKKDYIKEAPAEA